MKKNPIIPYILIMAFGIGLIFFLSLDGAGKKEEIAKGSNKTEQAGGASSAEFDPAAFAKSKCVSCHGADLKGGVGPALAGTSLSADQIKDIVKNGKNTMPKGLVPDANLDAMAEYILSLK